MIEEATKRATIKRPQAYDNLDEGEMEKEPPRRRFKAGDEEYIAAANRRMMGKAS